MEEEKHENMSMREVLDKLRSIEDRIEKLERRNRKSGLFWKSAIPPKVICNDVVTAYNGGLFKKFDYEMQVLADFYGIKPMENLTDPKKVPAKAIACYHAIDRTAYYKHPTATLDTLLHEFFHHLHSEGVVFLYSTENEEKCANEFAQIVIARGEE